MRVCSDLLDKEILKGLDQRERINYLHSRLTGQNSEIYSLREKIGDLKIENAGNCRRCEDLWAKAAKNARHEYAPDVSITINGVKYTEDEN